MKTLIILLALTASIAQAQTTTRCVRNWDNSITCTTTRGSGGF
jgi:hypothetical protein